MDSDQLAAVNKSLDMMTRPGTYCLLDWATGWRSRNSTLPKHFALAGASERDHIMVGIRESEGRMLTFLLTHYDHIVYLAFCMWRTLSLMCQAHRTVEGKEAPLPRHNHIPLHQFSVLQLGVSGILKNVEVPKEDRSGGDQNKHHPNIIAIPPPPRYKVLRRGETATAEFMWGAVANGQVDVVILMIDQFQLDIHHDLWIQHTLQLPGCAYLLDIAARENNVFIAKKILEHYWAPRTGRGWFLEEGRELTVVDSSASMNSAFSNALQTNSVEFVHFMLSGYPSKVPGQLDLVQAGSGSEAPLQVVASSSPKDDMTAIVRLLLAAGVDVEAKESGGDPPLTWAAVSNNVAVARVLLEEGHARVEGGVGRGLGGEWSPLNAVASQFSPPRSGHFERHKRQQDSHLPMLSLLLQHGADPSLLNHQGKTAAARAKEADFPEIVTLIHSFTEQSDKKKMLIDNKEEK